MNNLALYGASQSISSMISNSNIMPEGYLENVAPLQVVNAYGEFKRDTTFEEPVRWNKATWYVAPDDPVEYLDIPEVKNDKNVCGLTVPFTTE